jgi:alanyl-tRNA synthetase
VWQVALDRTAFYPTSGGQPHDTGTLAATAPSGARLEAPIISVEEDEHGEVWHLTPKPLLTGTRVEGLIDRQRRLDHTQQHSGQHLLSALFYREFGALTVSFHLGDPVSTVDLNTESLDATQLGRIEWLANEIVAKSLPVDHRVVSSDEAQRLLAEGKLRKLPPRSGDIRLIVIAGENAAGVLTGGAAPNPDLDVNACGGTHVSSTSQIGAVLIRGTERVRQSTRVSFLCGNRAIAAARAEDLLLTQLSREFSAPRSDLPAALTRLKSEARAAAKERQHLREELANYHAARLLVEDPPQNDLRIVRRIFPDRDADYIKLLASRVSSAAAHTVALLASTQPGQQQEELVTLVLACSPEPGRNAGELLRSVLSASDGRGGGSATLAQGLVPAGQLTAVLDALETMLRPKAVPAA